MKERTIAMKTQTRAIILMIICTLFAALGQFLYKLGSNLLVWDFIKLITNYYLISGIIIYMLAAIFMVLGFKYGELSVLYPIIGLTYVWILLISIYLLGETISIFRIVGIGFILGGVIFLGFGNKK